MRELGGEGDLGKTGLSCLSIILFWESAGIGGVVVAEKEWDWDEGVRHCEYKIRAEKLLLL